MSSLRRRRRRLPKLDLHPHWIHQPAEAAVVVADRRADRLRTLSLRLGEHALQVFDDEVDHERRGRRIVIVRGGLVDAPDAISACRLRPDHAAPVIELEAQYAGVPVAHRLRVRRLEEHAADAQHLGHVALLPVQPATGLARGSPARNRRTLSTAWATISGIASVLDPAVCGVSTAPGTSAQRSAGVGSWAKTSSAARHSRPSFSAATSTSSSISEPRPTLTIRPLGPTASITSAEIRPRFEGSARAATTRMSLAFASSSTLAALGQGACLSRGRHQRTESRMASARRATAAPMWPRPTTPRVRPPRLGCGFNLSSCRQRPSRTVRSSAGRLRQAASINPMAWSATSSAFRPSAWVTSIPRARHQGTSTPSYPTLTQAIRPSAGNEARNSGVSTNSPAWTMARTRARSSSVSSHARAVERPPPWNAGSSTASIGTEISVSGSDIIAPSGPSLRAVTPIAKPGRKGHPCRRNLDLKNAGRHKRGW